MHWLVHLMGWDSVSSVPYAFWSGGGGILVVWVASVVLIWWRTSCKAEWWCMLPGRHDLTDPATGAAHRLCWVHHPDVRGRNLGRERIAEIRRHIYLGDKPGKG